MAESLINTKRRINTIKSTEKITKAMKLVASVKFQRWRKYYQENLPYYQGMKNTAAKAIAGAGLSVAMKTECFQKKNGVRDLYVVITSTLGLCGAYNYQIFKELAEHFHLEDEMMFIGEKGMYRYQGIIEKSDTRFVSLMDEFSYSKVRRLRHEILQKYRTGEYKNVYLVYTHYKNSLTFIPTVEKICPLSYEDFSSEEESKELEPVSDVSYQTLLEGLIPHYLDSLLYNRLIESEVSEVSARRNAMESATDSADKIVKKLMITYNKTRQNAITQEITEVVAGATAGKKKENE